MLFLIFSSLGAIILAPLAGRYAFRKRVARDVRTLLSTTMTSVAPNNSRLGGTPCRHQCNGICTSRLRTALRPLARFVQSTGGLFGPNLTNVGLPIRGVEYFTAVTPGFVWSASISPAPLAWIDARDRLHNRRGNMLLKLESLFTIADVSPR
jgi:hypothetical protein